MAISADERDELRDLARRSLGERGATLLMAGLDVADLAAMEERLSLRMEVMRAELRGEMTQLRGEFGELRGEFGELKGFVGERIGAIDAKLGTQNRLFVASLLTILVALAVLAFSAHQLGAGA